MRRPGFIGMSAAIGLIAPAAIMAAPRPPPRAPAVQRVIDCRKLTEDAARLACFDAAVAAMDRAEAAGDLVSIDRAQRRAARRQAFGLPLPSLAFLDRGEKATEADRITVTIAQATQDPYGKWTFRLDDGAVWRQIDDNTIERGTHPGSTAEIRRGVLGSFTIKVDGQFPMKVHRER